MVDPKERAEQADDNREEFESLIDDISDAKENVREKYNELVQAWEDSWNWWKKNVFNRGDYEDEKEAVDGIWDRIVEKKIDIDGIEESVLDAADRVINHHAPVISLFRISGRWVEETFKDTSEIHADLTLPEHGRDIADWEGQARSAYDDIVKHQYKTVAQLQEAAGEVSTWLSDLGTGNVEFLSEMVSALSDLADTLIGEIGKITNTAGASVIWTVAELVGSVVSSGIDMMSTALENFASMAANEIEANKIIMDHSRFPNGEWPHAVSRP